MTETINVDGEDFAPVVIPWWEYQGLRETDRLVLTLEEVMFIRDGVLYLVDDTVKKPAQQV